MARIADISLKHEPQHFTFTISSIINFMEEYADFADKTLTKTLAYLNQANVLPISGPIVYFHTVDLENLHVEMGRTIVEPVDELDDMECKFVDKRTIATTIDQGPYEEQDPTLMELLHWIEENEYETSGPIGYCYLNDTNRSPTEFLTQMFIPLR